MVGPDFNRKTVEVLAKRAAYLCSSPECRVHTVGPNEDEVKATVIGEAAHIYAAKPSGPRYQKLMTDTARAEITNGIWLCRNCHKMIDSDPERFPADLLFAWREDHEKFVAESLGNSARLLKHETNQNSLAPFNDFPAIVRRIIIDKPEGWEFRLTAEIMRHLNRKWLRRLDDLRKGYYTRPLTPLKEDEVTQWVRVRLDEMAAMIGPLEGLLQRLTESWGAVGQPGDTREILRSCELISEFLERAVQHEEQLEFLWVPEEYRRLVSLLKDCIGSQADKIGHIPERLDHLVEQIPELKRSSDGKVVTVEETITLELPQNWEFEFERELKRINKLEERSDVTPAPQSGAGCLGFIILIVILALFFAMA